MQLESLSWFPGHMTKTRRMVASEIGSMDAVCEIIDARIPRASRNPDLDDLTAGKPRIVVLNRVDQADPEGDEAVGGMVPRAGLRGAGGRRQVRRGREAVRARRARVACGQAARLRGKGADRARAARDGARHPERRQIDLHQQGVRPKDRQGGGPPRRDARQAVGSGG